MSLHVAVGSTNPGKIKAVKTVCEQAFPGCTVTGIEVPSGVRVQPLGAAETAEGARNRARAALQTVPGAQLGMGLEGGMELDGQLIHCAVIVSAEGRENLAWSVSFPLPPPLVARVLAGEELSPVMDELTQTTDSRKNVGAVGILTNGLFTRVDMMHGALACALIPFLHPEFYDAHTPR